MEKTYVMIKPDAIYRNLMGEILSRFEKKGLRLAAMKMDVFTEEKIKEHYGQHAEKPFFPELSEFMRSGPVIHTIWEGKEAVSVVRRIVGSTNARNAEPGSIRGDYSVSTQCNMVHASDSIENAEIEIKRFFTEKEQFTYTPSDIEHLYARDERN